MVQSAIKLQIFLSEGCSGKLNLLPFAERITLRPPSEASKNRLSTKIVPDHAAYPESEPSFIYFEGAEKSGKMAHEPRRAVGGRGLVCKARVL